VGLRKLPIILTQLSLIGVSIPKTAQTQEEGDARGANEALALEDAQSSETSEPETLDLLTLDLGDIATAGTEIQDQRSPEGQEPLPRAESVIVGQTNGNPGSPLATRANSTVTKRQLQERLPRSAPDALRYEPGTYVQQTGHSQASAYVRGLTGQQTILMFDGIRLNNATFRQGPNQYFFTVDARSVAAIDVTRGSASVRHGSDALGGTINATPRDPLFLATVRRFRLAPRSQFRYASADNERGGRFEAEGQLFQRLAWLGGVGYRQVDLLEGGGRLRSPADDSIALVPRYADDGRTQLGTGFDELTFDQRFVLRLSSTQQLVAALYGYRQYDAPRTDQCPAPYAPANECLTYEEQFRTLSYLRYRGERLAAALDRLEATLSFQRQHERRRLDRPNSYTTLRGVDDDNVLGLALRAQTARWQPRPWLGLDLEYGADLFLDWVGSNSSITFTDVGVTIDESRGYYLDDSRYISSGLFALAQLTLPRGVALRLGGRLALIAARARADETTDSQAVEAQWFAPVGRVGLEWRAAHWISLLLNVDQGFRAPNLNDLTSRQQTGAGFQYENANLEPEKSLTVETGLKLETRWLRASAFVFWNRLRGAIARGLRSSEHCPAGTPQCTNSWTRVQLVNLEEPAHIVGAEAQALLRLPAGFAVRATLAYAAGDGPNPGGTAGGIDQVPLSRIPPLNGTAELRWHWRDMGLFAGAGLRWALAQGRLAPTDVSDERIPPGGTPGFAVLDLRAGYRLNQHFLVSMVFENVFDAVYRYHGSSVNGPGRGLILHLEVGL
jgi:iron complex outermembrane receptor protein/hemoglobin/transferrin/lactoferrin receptor protein